MWSGKSGTLTWTAQAVITIGCGSAVIQEVALATRPIKCCPVIVVNNFGDGCASAPQAPLSQIAAMCLNELDGSKFHLSHIYMCLRKNAIVHLKRRKALQFATVQEHEAPGSGMRES